MPFGWIGCHLLVLLIFGYKEAVGGLTVCVMLLRGTSGRVGTLTGSREPLEARKMAAEGRAAKRPTCQVPAWLGVAVVSNNLLIMRVPVQFYPDLYLIRSQIAFFQRVENARLAKNPGLICEWFAPRSDILKSPL